MRINGRVSDVLVQLFHATMLQASQESCGSMVLFQRYLYNAAADHCEATMLTRHTWALPHADVAAILMQTRSTYIDLGFPHPARDLVPSAKPPGSLLSSSLLCTLITQTPAVVALLAGC